MDELLQIDTPENVVFGYEVAGLGTRFLAALIDTLILAGLYMLVALGGAFIAGRVASLAEAASSVIIAVSLFASFIILWGYYIFFESFWNGQSPGKRILNIRVIRTDGTPAGVGEIAIRNLIRIVDFLPISYGVGVISMFANKQSRRLGDLAAGTLVVFTQEEVTLESLTPTNKTPTEIDAPSIPIEALNERDIAMVENYLTRRKMLVNRIDLLEDIVPYLVEKMAVEDPKATDARERLLVDILKARRRSRAG